MKAKLIAKTDISEADLKAVFGLFTTHFVDIPRESFDADWADKNYVILMKNEEGTLKGFSTIKIYETSFQEEILTVIYSGDTIMDPSAWRSSVLSRAWCASMAKLRESYSKGRFFWLLISSGYRTYRFLPVFWRRYYPHHERATPPKTQAMMHFLAQERFGKDYDETTGVVRFPSPQVLSEDLRGIPEERLKDPRIAFFNRVNPGHPQGDELVCLTEVTEENMTRACRRVWFSGTEI
jgi:hypothetical protein